MQKNDVIHHQMTKQTGCIRNLYFSVILVSEFKEPVVYT